MATVFQSAEAALGLDAADGKDRSEAESAIRTAKPGTARERRQKNRTLPNTSL